MHWYYFVSYFFGGAFLANGVPHFVSGITGKAFQTPFAKPPGEGLSSSTVNIFWSAFNIAVAYLLICQVGYFDLHDPKEVIIAGIGGLLVAVMLARHFGRFHGGNLE